MVGRWRGVDATLGDSARLLLVALNVQPEAEHAEDLRRRPVALVTEFNGSLHHRGVFLTHGEHGVFETAHYKSLGQVEIALRQGPQVGGAEVVPLERHLR